VIEPIDPFMSISFIRTLTNKVPTMVNLNREFFIIITYIMNVLTRQKKPTTKPQPVTSKKSQILTATKS
jgi:hypothetical protein